MSEYPKLHEYAYWRKSRVAGERFPNPDCETWGILIACLTADNYWDRVMLLQRTHRPLGSSQLNTQQVFQKPLWYVICQSDDW